MEHNEITNQNQDLPRLGLAHCLLALPSLRVPDDRSEASLSSWR